MNTALDKERQREYWRNELKGALMELPVYRDAPKGGTGRELAGCTCLLELDSTKLEQARLPLQWESILLACYLTLLHRLGHESDLLIGYTSEEGSLFPLRMDCSGTGTIGGLADRLTGKLQEMHQNQLQYSEIRELGANPLLLLATFGKPQQVEESLLNWHVYCEQGQWNVMVTYDRNSFSSAAIERYAGYYQTIVQAALEQIQTPLDIIELADASDWQAYALLNNTLRGLPEEATVVERFRAMVTAFPDRPALSAGAQELTYAQLDRQSNQVAQMLLAEGFAPGSFVSIFMERSLETIVSFLGVLKAGGAYVPLDPEHPEERNSYILSDTQSGFMITRSELKGKAGQLLAAAGRSEATRILTVDQDASSCSQADAAVTLEADDLAYVIYTSGSTGKPKGVLIGHQGVVNLAVAIRDDLGLHEQDVLLQYSTFSFDASVYDIFGALLNGCRLHLLSYEQRFSIDLFTEAVEAVQATRISILPTVFFNQLAAYLPESDASRYSRIKSLVVGGEALSGETVRQFQKKLGCRIKIVNAYGPTECTVASTSLVIDEPLPEQVATVCIGTPLANYQVYIVNAKDRLCPVNVTGELLISSVGVAKGYLNQPEKTAQAFISDPVHPQSGQTFYRSGDMVRLLANGQIEYAGRKDSQVKIRGYRIEIGEIEDNLARHDALKDAAVIVRTDTFGEKSLAAFYTTTSGAVPTRQELAEFLGKKVPAYMVPEAFQWLDHMPVTPSGKIDRRALSSMELTEPEGRSGEYVGPSNVLEEQVCRVWEQVLHKSPIGITDNFFEIGGHSLKILEILVALKPEYPNLKINDFFQYPTVEQLSARIGYLKHEEVAIAQVDWAHEPVRDLVEHPAVLQGSIDRLAVYRQEHILLTGATGFLGSHLLFELLTRSQATVYCLLRPHTAYTDPLERLAQVMARYFGEAIRGLLNQRVVIIEGDLEKADLGLSHADSQLLEQQLDSIIHCGAEVKHFGDLEYFTRVNVDSTERLLRLVREARSKRNVRFHYISTLGIPEELALSGQWDRFLSSAKYDDDAYVENVYTESKLEAERLVVQVGEQEGMAVSIYRVGNLCCRSDNGLFQANIDNNAFYRMLKAMLLLGTAPRAYCYMDVTPVNYAGASIAALALAEETVGGLFHICNPVQVSFEDLVGYFQAYGYEIGFMEMREYETWLLDSGTAKDEEGLRLAMTQLEGDGAKHSQWIFSCDRTIHYLYETDVICKVPDGEFFGKLIAHAIEAGYFPAPRKLSRLEQQEQIH